MMINILPVFWRDVKVSTTNSAKLVNHFVNPIVSLIFFAVMFSIYVREVHYGAATVRFIDFFVPGLLGMQAFMLFSMTFSMVRIDNVSGFLTNVAISRTGIHAYYIGSLLSNIVMTILRTLLLVAAAHVVVGSPLPTGGYNILLIVLGLLLGSVFWFSLGFICGVFIVREDMRDFVFSLILPPLTFASSLYYTADQLPEQIRGVILLNPLTHMVNLIRAAFLLQTPEGVGEEMVILTVLAVLLGTGALLSLRRILR